MNVYVGTNSLKNAYIGDVYEYSYDFRGKTAAQVAADGWTTTIGTSSLSSSGINIVGYSGVVVKSGFNLSSAKKITISWLFYSDGYAIFSDLSNGTAGAGFNFDIRQNFRRLIVDSSKGSQTQSSGMTSGEKTCTIVYDLVNKTAVCSVTGYSDITMTIPDSSIETIRSLNSIRLCCYSSSNSSQNIYKTINLLVE